MSTNIFVHVEKIISLNNQQMALAQAEFHLSNDYYIMDKLAGIKNPKEATIKPRGLPTSPQISHGVRNHFYVPVLKSDEIEKFFPHISKIKDEKVKEECFLGMTASNETQGFLCESMVRPDMQQVTFEDKTGRVYVPRNRWHTPSWLTLTEAKSVRDSMEREIKSKSKLKSNKQYDIKQIQQFDAILLYMWAIEGDQKDKTRMIYWFNS